MAISLDNYRSKLIKKIFNANSVYEVNRYINTAIKSLIKRKVNGYIILRFVDKIISQLENIQMANSTLQDMATIQLAKIQLVQIRGELKYPNNRFIAYK